MPNSDLFDRAEGYGHTAGTQDSKDDADWDTAVAVLADRSEDLDTRLARSVATPNAASRQSISPDLDSVGAWDGTNTTTGSNTALTSSSIQEVTTLRTIDAMDADERAAIGFADRSSGWGHTAGSLSDLND